MAVSIASNHLLRIGEVAIASRLPVKTIRYYDDIGLLKPNVERSDSRYRLFTAAVLNRLSFIKRAQALGLSLSEIQHILQVHDAGNLPCGAVRQHLQSKLDEIHAQIQSLETLKSELQGILSGWQDNPSSQSLAQSICPNISGETIGETMDETIG